MAGTEVNLYGVGDVDLTAMMDTLDRQRITFHALSLTNYDNTSLPAIAAGSHEEVAGTLFKFAGEEAITGWAGIGNDTAAYIKLVPAGTDPDTVTAEFTDISPTWSDAKQGYYGTGGNANHKYVAGLYKVDAATYSKKRLYKSGPAPNVRTDEVFDEAITSAKIGFADLTDGLKEMASTEEWTPPKGIYTYVVRDSTTTLMAIYANAAWRNSNTGMDAGMFMTDGSNVKFIQTVGTTGSIYYLKLD